MTIETLRNLAVINLVIKWVKPSINSKKDFCRYTELYRAKRSIKTLVVIFDGTCKVLAIKKKTENEVGASK